MLTPALESVLAAPNLPSLPTVAVQILELTSKENAQLREIARCIERDQAISTKVLRTVNSSFYGLPKRCGNIQQAIAYLGLQTVKGLVLGFSLASCVDGGGTDDVGFDFVRYWQRALYTASATKELAAVARDCDADEAFVASLVQDIGMVALWRAYDDKYLQVLDLASRDHRKLAAAETRAFEVDHAQVGAEMARRWRFPDAIATAIETHHADERSPSGSDSFSRLVRLGLCAAESILAEPAQAEAALDRFRRLGAIWFDIKPREALALLQQISDMSKELADVFDMDAGDPLPIDELMERAEAEKNRQALVDPLAAEKNQADIDPITHLPDRKRFLAEFETAFGDSKDMKRPLGLVLVSIDEGRRLANAPADSGDGRLLASAAALVRSTINVASPLYRFVGAEFVAVLEGANATVAAQVGDFIRQRFASAPILFEDDEGGPDRRELTVTVGVAALEPNEASGLTTTSPDAVLQAAMCAVATGQRSGGNVLVRGGGAASDGHDDLASVA